MLFREDDSSVETNTTTPHLPHSPVPLYAPHTKKKLTVEGPGQNTKQNERQPGIRQPEGCLSLHTKFLSVIPRWDDNHQPRSQLATGSWFKSDDQLKAGADDVPHMTPACVPSRDRRNPARKELQRQNRFPRKSSDL